MIGKYLKSYKKTFLHDCKEDHARKNSDWRKRWMPMIKYDHDFDGNYFLSIIMHKLNIMYDYYDFGYYTMQSDESKKEILDTLKEAIELGKKIQIFDYYEKMHNFLEEHLGHVISVYDKPLKIGKGWSDPIHEIVYWRKEGEGREIVLDYLDNTDTLWRKWAVDNGYDPKTLYTSYSGKWDDEKNNEIYQKISKECAKTEQKDIDKFFKLLAKNYRKWWD